LAGRRPQSGDTLEMEALEKHYLALAKTGILLTDKEMQDYSKSEDLKPRPTLEQIRSMRSRSEYIANHARWVKPPHFVKSSIDRLGNIFIDVGIYKQNLRVVNKGHFILLVAVDLLSQRISCYTFPNKSRQSWERGIAKFVKDFPCIRCFITDRDTAISSISYQESVFETYGIKWVHLRNRSKSYAAEKALAYLKSRVSQGLALQAKGDNKWLGILASVIKDYNERFVKGTNIRRIDVDKSNELQVLAQKFKVEEFTPIFNTSVFGSFSKKMYKSIGFKHAKGDKVLLSRSANYNLKSDAFLKKSVEGSYGKTVYEVSNVFLKASADGYFVKMLTLKNLHGIFYSSEVVKALFPEDKSGRDKDAEDRKKKAAAAKRKRERK
jgi:hypothetical protein